MKATGEKTVAGHPGRPLIEEHGEASRANWQVLTISWKWGEEVISGWRHSLKKGVRRNRMGQRGGGGKLGNNGLAHTEFGAPARETYSAKRKS